MTGGPDALAEARQRLGAARRVAVVTGAGISAESGVPTFRGPGGLWRQRRPEDLATPEAFAEDPRLVWEWYDGRRQAVAAVAPNAGHAALVRLEAAVPGFGLFTQNVDGLHERAGSRRVVRLHGSLWEVRCTVCGETREDRTVPLAELPPRCACGGLLRPGVVWFGEALDPAVIGAAFRAARAADITLVVGTSSVVHPAAGIAMAALEAGRVVIEVNPEETPLTPFATVVCQGPAGEVLPAIVATQG